MCFSGDKLLGGPQAGLMVGTREAIDACRRHPLARAVRIDKLSLAALEATLALYREPERALREIPVLRMLLEDPAPAGARGSPRPSAARSSRRRRRSAAARCRCSSCRARSSRSTGPPEDLAARLRAADPPVIGRIQDGRLLLDPRTLADDEVELVAAALA